MDNIKYHNISDLRTLLKSLFKRRWKIELVILLTLAIISTLIVAAAPKHDLGLAGAAIPVFIFAAVMGLRRNWRRADEKVAPIEISE